LGTGNNCFVGHHKPFKDETVDMLDNLLLRLRIWNSKGGQRRE
jgi:hypothetical protein